MQVSSYLEAVILVESTGTRIEMITLGVDIVFGVEFNRVDLQRKCGVDVITQRIGEICHTQTLYNAV